MITIFTVCDQKYSGYVEMFQLFARKAYPEYEVAVEQIESKFPYEAACRRFLLAPQTFGFSDVWISDIDIMVLRESPTIQEFHRAEMLETGLSYSNTSRNNSEPKSYERFTGLHYATKDWYFKTEEVRRRYLWSLSDGDIGKDFFDDEIMLMNICKTLGPIPSKKPLFKRHHGIHVGTIRHYKSLGKEMVNTQLRLRISPQQARQYCEVLDTEEYRKAFDRIEDQIIKAEFEIMESFTRSWSKV